MKRLALFSFSLCLTPLALAAPWAALGRPPPWPP